MCPNGFLSWIVDRVVAEGSRPLILCRHCKPRGTYSSRHGAKEVTAREFFGGEEAIGGGTPLVALSASLSSFRAVLNLALAAFSLVLGLALATLGLVLGLALSGFRAALRSTISSVLHPLFRRQARKHRELRQPWLHTLLPRARWLHATGAGRGEGEWSACVAGPKTLD